MDFKKFGTFVLLLGVLIFVAGGIYWSSNQPKQFNRSESKPWLLGGRNDIGNFLNVQSQNITRSRNRDKAIVIMIAGGIVALVGMGIASSAKPSKEKESVYRNIEGNSISPLSQDTGEDVECPSCGATNGASGNFCEICGVKL